MKNGAMLASLWSVSVTTKANSLSMENMFWSASWGASSEYQRSCSSYPHLTAFMNVSTAAFLEIMRNFRPSPWAGRPWRKAAMSVDPLDMIVMLHSSSDVLVSASSHPRGILNMETLLPGASTEYRRSSIEADTESSKMVM